MTVTADKGKARITQVSERADIRVLTLAHHQTFAPGNKTHQAVFVAVQLILFVLMIILLMMASPVWRKPLR